MRAGRRRCAASAINAAGPRDPETGFPIGGAGALINSTELRLPPPTLPWLGNTVSFVLFHDMGNVFANAGDAWESALRIRQPDRAACKAALANVGDPNSYIPNGMPYFDWVQGHATSTTSRTRRDWGCATIRRWDRSDWISAIT